MRDWIWLTSVVATRGLSASMLTPMITCACRSSTRRLVTAAQAGVIVQRTQGGCFMPVTGHHDQSVLSPPIRSVRPPCGDRLRMSCSNGTSGSAGSVPVSFSTSQKLRGDPDEAGTHRWADVSTADGDRHGASGRGGARCCRAGRGDQRRGNHDP